MFVFAANFNFMGRGLDHITKTQNSALNLKGSYKRVRREFLYSNKIQINLLSKMRVLTTILYPNSRSILHRFASNRWK